MGDTDLKIHISATAELAALRSLEAETQRNIVKLEALKIAGRQIDEIQLAKFKTELASVQSALGNQSWLSKFGAELQGYAAKIPGVGEAMRALNGATGPLSQGFMVLSAAVTAAGVALHEFAKAEAAVTRMDAALANMGMLTDTNRVAFQGLAKELQETTGVARDEWYSILERLIKTGKVQVDQVEQHTTAIKNLAGLLGGDITTATHLYTMALQGNFSMLGRHGIVLNENATATEKLADLQRQAAQRGAGILEAQTQTLTGAFKAAGHGVAELTMSIGGWLASILPVRAVAQGIGDSLSYWGEQIGMVVPQLDGLENKVGAVSETAPKAGKHLKQLADYTAALATATENSATALERENTALATAAKAAEEKLKAQQKLKLAELEARDDLTPQQKAVEQAKLTGAGAEELFQLKQTETQARIANLTTAEQAANQKLSAAQERLREQQGRARMAAAQDAKDQLLQRQKTNAQNVVQSSEQEMRNLLENSDLPTRGFNTDAWLKSGQSTTAIPFMRSFDGSAMPFERKIQDLDQQRQSAAAVVSRSDRRLADSARWRSDWETPLGSSRDEGTAAADLAKQITGEDGKGGLQAETTKQVAELQKQLAAAKAELASRAAVRPIERQAEQKQIDADQRKANIAARKTQHDADQKSRAADIQAAEDAEKNDRHNPALLKKDRDRELALRRQSAKAEADELQHQIAENPAETVKLTADRKAALQKSAEELNKARQRQADEDAKAAGAKGKPEINALTGPQLEAELYPPVNFPPRPPKPPKSEAERARSVDWHNEPAPAPEISRGEEIPAPPKPVDVAPVAGALKDYFSANEAQHAQTDAEIAALTKEIFKFTAALTNLKGNLGEVKNS